MSDPSATRGVSKEQVVVYGLLTAFGLFALILALGYGLFKEEFRVGPGLVPAVVGGLIALIAGWELVATLRGQRTPHNRGLAAVVAASVGPAPVDAARGGAPGGGTSSGGSASVDAGPVGTVASAGHSVAPDDGPGAGSPERHDENDVDIFGRTPAMRARQLMIVFVALTVTVLLVPLLGFLVAFFLLSLFISAVVERRTWISSAIVSFVAVVVIYAVFVGFLDVPLPTGLIGIGG
jgi:hypothetical protein